jgi:DNA polymerase-1
VPGPLLILDGDSLAHRAYHALPPIEGAKGRPINALVGFANRLLVLVSTFAPRAVLACWDTLGAPTYRSRLWPAYQAGREFEPEIVEQLGRLPGLVCEFGFASVRAAGYEADDLAATAARIEREAGGSALVVTSDRDAYQLVGERVTVLAPRTGGQYDRIGPAEVRERYGVDPKQVPSFIALRGDPADNLPGARGIGAKTAAALLARHGDLAGVIAHARDLSPRQALALADPRLIDFLRIATMDASAPVEPVPDAVLDPARASAHAAAIGAARLAERLAAMGGGGA